MDLCILQWWCHKNSLPQSSVSETFVTTHLRCIIFNFIFVFNLQGGRFLSSLFNLTLPSTVFCSSPSLWLLFSLSRSTARLSDKTAGERGREPQLRGERKPSTISHLVQRWTGGCLARSLKQKACWEIHSLGEGTSWTEKLYSGGGSPWWQW